MTFRPALTAAILLVLPGALARAQDRPSPGPAPQGKEVVKSPTKEKAPHLQWPKLSAVQKDLAQLRLKLLGHGNKEKAAKAAEGLKALGPGVTPYLFRRLSDQSPKLNGVLGEIAKTVLDKKYAPLLVPYLEHRLLSVRRLGAELLIQAGDAAQAPALRKALDEAKDEGLRETLALGLCSLGDLTGLPLVYELTVKDFLKRRQEILAAVSRL